MYSAVEIAKFIISYCMDMGTPISNLQLQKILYFLQVFYMRKGFPLFEEEIYAWQHGPVIPEVYYMFSGYGASRIQNRYAIELDPATEAAILPIIEKLRVLDAWTLVRMTHEENYPWDMVYNKGVDPTGVIDKRLLSRDHTDLGA